MKIKSIIVPCFLWAGTIATIAGCAVMRVDVDVYKGPMANHEEVQTEQMSAMAIGAKPILIELRDQLELSRYKDTNDTKGPEPRRLLDIDTFRGKYIMGYMQLDMTNPELKDEGAIRVNAILSLYEDGYDSELTPFIQNGKGALDRYGIAWGLFTKIPAPTDKGSWKNLEKAMKKDPSIERLKGAYQTYLCGKEEHPWVKDPKVIIDEYNKLDGKNLNSSLGSNDAFDKLSNRDIVESHAKKLFADNAEQKNDFIDRVTLIAQNFLEGRQALRDLFRTILSSLVVFGDKDKDTQNKYAAIQLATNLIQPEHFKAVLNSAKKSDDIPKDVKSLYDSIVLKNDLKLDTISATLLKSYLRDEFEKNTICTASALLKADDLFKDNDIFRKDDPYKKIGIEEEKIKEFIAPVKRKFGLVGVPTIDMEITDDLADRFAVIAKGSAAGLESGRLSEGIDTLTKRYLEAAANKNKNQGSDDSVKGTRDQLVDTLIHFSEKVLVIANNKMLLEKSHGSKMDKYTLVLQSIGNSILLQADELRQQGSYRDKIVGNANQEARAISSAFLDDPKAYLNNIVYEVTVKKEAAEKKLSEIKTSLKKELDNYPDTSIRTDFAKPENNFETAPDKFDTLVHGYWIEKNTAREKAESEKADGKTTWDCFESNRNALIAALKPSETPSYDIVIQKINGVLLDKNVGAAEKGTITTTIKYLVDNNEFLKKYYTNTNILPSTDQDCYSKISQAVFANKAEKEKEFKVCDDIIAILKKIESLKSEFVNAKDDVEKNSADDKIKEARKEVLVTIDNDKAVVSTSSAVHLQLLKALQDKIKLPEADNTVNNIAVRRAISVVEEMKPTQKVDIGFGNAKDSKAVFDQLISTLRAGHLNAITQYGVDSASAKKYSDAIETAYNYRSGMVSIRPPSAYLRSSTPATSLQADPGLGWQNMLTEHSWRSIPFYGYAKNYREHARTVAEIDKQFWQNINSVRVAGAGRTNYVIAKDDVGNWYVKRYSADTEDIIKSAKKLAMFNMGSQMNMNLVSRITSKDGMLSGTQQSTQQTATQQNNEANRTTLERLFDKHKGLYGEKTNTAFGTLTKMLKPEYGDGENKMSEVENVILKSWSNSKDYIDANFLTTIQTSLLAVGTSTLNPAYTKLAKLDADLTEKQGKKEITSDEVIYAKANEMLDAYYGIHQFQSSLSDRIPLLNLTGTATAEYSVAKDSLGSSTAELAKLKGEQVLLNTALDSAKKARADFTDTSNQAEITKLDDNVKAAQKQVDDKNVAITDADKKMHDDENKLRAAEQKLELTKNGVKIATEDVSRIVRERLEGLVAERIDTVGDYERGILFIGDAIKEEK